MMLQHAGGAYDGPLLGALVLILTFPVSFICTLIALGKVGPRRCKLAWLSLLSFIAIPLLVVAVGETWAWVWRTIR